MGVPERPYVPWQEALAQGSRARFKQIERIRQVKIGPEEASSRIFSDSFWERHRNSLATVAAILGVPLGLSFLSACSQPPAIVREATPIPEATPTLKPTATSTPELKVTPTPTKELPKKPTEVLPTPTRESKPTPTHTPEPIRTPIPELPRLLETIKLPIPDLTIERYAVKFEEMTSEVPKSHKSALKKWATQPYTVPYHWHIEYKQCGLLLIDYDSIRPHRPLEHFFYDGKSERFYKTGMLADGTSSQIGEEDKRILNWQGDLLLVAKHMADLSCDGKVLYRVSKKTISGSVMISEKTATIMSDIFNRTKTIIKNGRPGFFNSELSDDGNKLLLSFPDDTDAKRGTYLIDFNSWRVQFHLNESSYETFLNEDGSLLYLLPEEYTDRVGYIYNTITGGKTPISWPDFLTSYEHRASPNLHYIARKLGMFPSAFTMEGQWGIVVQTPTGRFIISSPSRSFSPWKIDNDGTIYTTRGDIFIFKDGAYKLAKNGE